MAIRYAIDIELFAAPGAPPDAGALQASIAAELANWWPAFGLPSEPGVSVRLRPEPAGLFDFTLRLNGHACPVPVLHPAQHTAPLFFRIMNALFYNRERLVTEEQLRLIRHECLGVSQTLADWSSTPLSFWHKLATLLLEHGFGLNRLSHCFKNWHAGCSPEELFESIVGIPNALSLQVQLNPVLTGSPVTAGESWDELLPAFYEEIYQEWGILLPEIKMEPVAGLPLEQFRLRFNDFWLPVLPGLGAGEALYDDPEAGPEVYVPGAAMYYSKQPPTGDPDYAPVVESPGAYLLNWIKYWAGQLPGWYLNTEITEGLLDNLEESNRSLIIMIRDKWPAYRLCGLLRNLLQDGVRIRNLAEILDVLLRIEGPLVADDTASLIYFTPVNRVVTVPPGISAPAEFTTEQYISQVRASLKFPVVYPFMEHGVLPCYNLEPGLLRDLRDGFLRHSFPGPDSAFHQLLTSIRDMTAADSKPVLLVPTTTRPAISATLRPYFPQLTVIGQEEVPPFFIPQVKNTIPTFP